MSRSYNSTTLTYKLFVLDTGTTSKDPSTGSLTSLAVLEFDPLSSKNPSHFSSYIRPPHLSPHVYVPRFRKVFTALRTFIDAATPTSQTPLFVSHNAPFDTAFLQAELKREGISVPPSWRFACSLRLAGDLLGNLSCGLSQAALADHFNVSVLAEHHCHDDVRVLSEILESIARHRADPHDDDKDAIQDVVDKLTDGASSLSYWADRYDVSSPLSTLVFFADQGNPSFHHERYCESLCQQLATGRSVNSCLLADVHNMPHCHRCVHGRSERDSDKHVETSPTSIRFTSTTASTSTTLQTIRHPVSNTVPNRNYIQTRTGEKYHIDPECYGLRKAKKLFYVTTPRSDLTACSICVDGSTEWRDVTPSPAEREPEASSSTVSGGREFITTRTGECFHDDRDCYGLRNAREKITVTDLPSGLRPCRLCTNGKMPDKPTRNSSRRSGPIRDEGGGTDGGVRQGDRFAGPEVPEALKMAYTKFYKTPHGGKMHMDRDCRTIRGREVLVCDPSTEDKDPCRVCSLKLFQELEIRRWCQFCKCKTQIGALHSVVSSPDAGSSVKRELSLR